MVSRLNEKLQIWFSIASCDETRLSMLTVESEDAFCWEAGGRGFSVLVDYQGEGGDGD